MKVLVTQSYNPEDCSLPGSSVHGTIVYDSVKYHAGFNADFSSLLNPSKHGCLAQNQNFVQNIYKM